MTYYCYVLQLQEEPVKRGVPTAKYHSIFQAAGSIIREEGLSSMWKGHVPAQALSIIYGVAQVITLSCSLSFLLIAVQTEHSKPLHNRTHSKLLHNSVVRIEVLSKGKSGAGSTNQCIPNKGTFK